MNGVAPEQQPLARAPPASALSALLVRRHRTRRSPMQRVKFIVPVLLLSVLIAALLARPATSQPAPNVQWFTTFVTTDADGFAIVNFPQIMSARIVYANCDGIRPAAGPGIAGHVAEFNYTAALVQVRVFGLTGQALGNSRVQLNCHVSSVSARTL
jgi:hypothetical protein